MVQKRLGPDADPYLPADLIDDNGFQGSDRRFGLASGGAEEVKSCRPTRRRAASRMARASRPTGTHQTLPFKMAGASPVENAVDIPPFRRVEARVKGLIDNIGGDDIDVA